MVDLSVYRLELIFRISSNARDAKSLRKLLY
uniref:Uncharacterized protein n=1 Tax=Rhizophora mucronata TaxID=61149 RepID=A0A2P2R368_RHIMU